MMYNICISKSERLILEIEKYSALLLSKVHSFNINNNEEKN